MSAHAHADPGRAARIGAALAVTLSLGLAGVLAPAARADGNASSAAAFIESAQNRDGGFPDARGGRSRPQASLWATTALLAAGKNPADEHVNNGTAAGDYLAAHLSGLRALEDEGLLALIQAASGAPAGRFGDPGAALRVDLVGPAVRADPGGAAMGIIGLVALRDGRTADATAQSLLGVQQPDGGWGRRGDTDSTSTALVLAALAQTAAADASSPAVQHGLAYLHSAQVNDGSIATSDRTDASSSGNVAATAFTIQALVALRQPMLRTSTGTTVRQGLTSYQQLSSGGLSPFGAYDTGVAPSVIETAQAYPAFDGIAFPLPYVAPLPAAPKPAATKPTAANRASVGTTAAGISNTTTSGHKTVSAYSGASAAGAIKGKLTRHPPSASPQVTGSVVGAGPAPKLATAAGRAPAKDESGLLLGLGLLAFIAVGGAFEIRRPAHSDRSLAARAVQAGSDLVHAGRRRGALAPAAAVLVAVALITLPSAVGMWRRAPQGAVMLKAFAPYMTQARLAELRGDVATLDRAVRATAAHGPALQFPRSGTAAQRRFLAANPEVAAFVSQWSAIDHRFSGMLDPMQANRANFAAVASLPSLRLFPWFLVIPGIALAALGAVGLIAPGLWRFTRWGAVLVGAGLVLAPVALGLFSAAPRGARLIDAFATVETRPAVTAVQHDFSTIVVGESSLQTELPAHVARRLPAVRALNSRYVRILGDFTPMLGVMSDNVPRYEAVASLPDFRTFPWLFLIPGLAGIVLSVLGLARRPPSLTRGVAAAETPLHARSRA